MYSEGKSIILFDQMLAEDFNGEIFPNLNAIPVDTPYRCTLCQSNAPYLIIPSPVANLAWPSLCSISSSNLRPGLSRNFKGFFPSSFGLPDKTVLFEEPIFGFNNFGVLLNRPI